MNRTKKSVITSKHSENKHLRITLIVILTIFVGIILGVISYTVYNISNIKPITGNILSYRELNTSIDVGKRVGINGDRNGLKFGLNSPGGGGTKFIDINSTQRALVNVYISGNISEYLSVEKNSFIIERGEFVHLAINLELPTNITYGNYTGVVTVILTKP